MLAPAAPPAPGQAGDDGASPQPQPRLPPPPAPGGAGPGGEIVAGEPPSGRRHPRSGVAAGPQRLGTPAAPRTATARAATPRRRRAGRGPLRPPVVRTAALAQRGPQLDEPGARPPADGGAPGRGPGGRVVVAAHGRRVGVGATEARTGAPADTEAAAAGQAPVAGAVISAGAGVGFERAGQIVAAWGAGPAPRAPRAGVAHLGVLVHSQRTGEGQAHSEVPGSDQGRGSSASLLRPYSPPPPLPLPSVGHCPCPGSGASEGRTISSFLTEDLRQ